MFSPEIDEKAYTLAKKYTWQISEDKLLDPTDQNGYLGLEISYMFGILKMSTTLARLNEPPQGYDVSAFTRVTAESVEVVTEKDIFPDGKNISLTFFNQYIHNIETI